MDCGDRAADWLHSVLSIENIRLVHRQSSDDIVPSHVNSQQSTDDTQLISDVKSTSTTAHG